MEAHITSQRHIEHAFILVVDGKIHSVRPDKAPGLMELKQDDSLQFALDNLLLSDWRLAPDQKIPVSGECEIELQREFDLASLPNVNACNVPVEGEGTFAEQVKRIQHRFEVNGWDLISVFTPINRGPMVIFTKPEGTPDKLPFVEPNVKE